jgi:ElaB/YqjD/DUF883 family membrane-anchored ribosome-binding protein
MHSAGLKSGPFGVKKSDTKSKEEHMARERDINEILGENVDKVKERVDNMRERIEDAADMAKSRGEEAWKDAVKFTQKHPAQAIGLAFVVGAAIGVLFFGRSRD